jgi:hypothetical protein
MTGRSWWYCFQATVPQVVFPFCYCFFLYKTAPIHDKKRENVCIVDCRDLCLEGLWGWLFNLWKVSGFSTKWSVFAIPAFLRGFFFSISSSLSIYRPAVNLPASVQKKVVTWEKP